MNIEKQFQADAESGKIKLHHGAYARGYIRLKDGARICQYKGRFGEGYTIEHPNSQTKINGKYSNSYHYMEYYIFTNK